MTPRTRNSTKNADSKVYYSKKVPQQVYFPHRRKTVRRPDGTGKDATTDKRQMRFLPEKMKIRRVNTVQDSDEEEEDDVEGGVVAIDGQAELAENDDQRSPGRSAIDRVKKRRRDVAETDDEPEDQPSRPMSKRRRKAAPNSTARSRPIKAKSEDSGDTTTTSARGQVDRSRTLTRQSTMTQLVEGRRPLSDADEPDFKPVKRSSRVSWGGQSKKSKDKRQRTLTQMVSGIRPTESLSDADPEEELVDAEAEDRESQAYGEAVAARLAQGGLVQEESHDATGMDAELDAEGVAMLERVPNKVGTNCHKADADNQAPNFPSVVVDSVEHHVDEEDEDEEETYDPTQFIDAPVTKTRRSPRPISGMKQGMWTTAEVSATNSRSKRKSKFSLLSTPEKRRIREIPSSQSPADSPLSTQVTPSKKPRSPLKERSGNKPHGVDTPSKRKQVTFRESIKTPIPPPTLRKFKSTIQDSEEDDDEDDDGLLETHESASCGHAGAHKNALIQDIDNTAQSRTVGSETQAMLVQIDEACARGHDREPPEKLQESAPFRVQHDPSPELGDQPRDYASKSKEESQDANPLHSTAHAGFKEEYWGDVEMLDLTTQNQALQIHMPMVEDADSVIVGMHTVSGQIPSSPPIVQQQVEDACSSTCMVIMDSSDEEEDEIRLTPPVKSTPRAPQPSSTAFQQSADLDEQLIQVPRSPAAHHNTQQSHSSKAEQQLHNEWFSYSQYVNARPPASSSMHVAHDKFSYHATPMPPRPLAPPQPAGHYMSQATTVDEVTPRKNRTQLIYSANTTPHKIASSQPTMSPSKLPPLFIPSSFPSPTKARMEDWSSPILGHTQMAYGGGGSLEDFSIPPPPPVEEEWVDG